MKRNPRTGLFRGYWFDLNGKQVRRLRPSEYGEFYRLWAKHRDIRLGIRPFAEGWLLGRNIRPDVYSPSWPPEALGDEPVSSGITRTERGPP